MNKKKQFSVCCDLIGRLGNNFFQICAAVGFAEKYGVEFYIPAWDYSDCFKTKFTKYAKGNARYGEEGFHYTEIPFIKDVKLYGYFQSEKYFKHCEGKIRELFQFNDTIKNKINEKYKLSVNTCSIHIRRGDYIGNGLHEVCHLSYYNNAIAEIKKRTSIDLFVVFSDEIEWAKNNLKGENFLFVEGNSDIVDLCLMSQCSHNIICNSSFSWWGAWLNNNPNKIIIAPNKWFNDGGRINTKDLLPDSWIKINVE